MLSSVEILILSIIQGISEFLPVSSAAHFVLVSKYYAFTNQSLLIDICLHLGSLIAITFYFRNDLFNFIKNKSFILLTSGFFVCGFHITLVGTHVPKYVIDKGLESWTAATILSLIGLFNIFGSLASGYLSSIMSKKVILSSIYFLRGVSIVFFIFLPPSNISAFIFGASFGFLWLSTVPATSGIVAHIFGTKYLGLLYGIVFLSHQIGSFFGAYLGGLFYDLYGSYDYAWYLAIALSVFAGIIHLPIIEKPVTRLATI